MNTIVVMTSNNHGSYSTPVQYNNLDSAQIEYLKETFNICIGKNVTLCNGVKIWQNCKIGDGSIIEHHSVVMDGCEIGSGVIIDSNTEIGDNTFIGNDAVIGDNVYIHGDCYIENNVVIGDNAVIHAKVSLHESAKIGSKVTLQYSVIVGLGAVIENNALIPRYQCVGINARPYCVSFDVSKDENDTSGARAFYFGSDSIFLAGNTIPISNLLYNYDKIGHVDRKKLYAAAISCFAIYDTLGSTLIGDGFDYDK